MSTLLQSSAAHPILVTGATGFLGAHIVSQLLHAGHHVRATVRSPSSIPKLRTTLAQPASPTSPLTIAIVPDLTAPGAFTAAAEGVVGIIHSASPFVLKVESIENDLLKPAINGTLEILEAAAATPTCARVVIISSFAAALNLEAGSRPGYTYTSADWNPSTYETARTGDALNGYGASKTLAEKAGWDFVAERKPHFELVTTCPAWIFGPRLDEIEDLGRLNESTGAIYRLINGTLKEVPGTDFGAWVDVRNIAKASIQGLVRPGVGGKRYLVTGGKWNYQDAVDAILEEFPELEGRVPVGKPGSGKDEIDLWYKVDSSPAQKELGIDWIDLKKLIGYSEVMDSQLALNGMIVSSKINKEMYKDDID